MSFYLDDPSLSLDTINFYENFETILRLVDERLYAVELWEAYFKCVQVSKIKNQKEVYVHQQIKIYQLRDSVRHILWNRQEYLNSVQVVTPVFNLIEKCENFERQFSHLQFVDY